MAGRPGRPSDGGPADVPRARGGGGPGNRRKAAALVERYRERPVNGSGMEPVRAGGGTLTMADRHDLRTVAPRRARGRVDPHHPRGGRRVRAPGAAVLGRQGLGRRCCTWPRRRSGRHAPVPGDARRHRPQLPRGHRVPRPRASPSSARGWSWRRCRSRSTGAGWSRRPARGPAATACRPRRCSTPSRSTASTPCSAAPAATRRRPGPRSGCSRFRDDFGQWDPKNQRPELWSLYNGRHRKGEHIRVFPISQLDRARHLAVHRRGGHRAAVDLLRPRARGVPPRRDAPGGQPVPAAAVDGEEAVQGHRALPHRRRRHVHRRVESTAADASTTSSPRSPPPASPSGAPPAPTTASPKPPWKTARRRGTSDGEPMDRGRRRGSTTWSSCASPPPAPSTTASRRSSAGCSTTPRRSSRTSSRRVERASQRAGRRATSNLALLTDGLRAEREQGITIDVAYRYFATPQRKFIIADTPGHVQYTRNMVTGASTADLALVLVDARKGVVEQTRRHAFLASLLRIPHLVVCVNKMDLVDYDQDRFDEHQGRVPRLRHQARHRRPARSSRSRRCTATTSSTRSENMPWYEGSSLLHHLEEVHIASRPQPHRRPLPGAVRDPAARATSYHDYRGYAGTVAGGVFKPGDEVVVLPSGFTSTHRVDRHLRRPGRRGVRADVGHHPPRRRHRRQPRRHDLPPAQPAPRRPRTSTPWCAG